MDYWEDVLNSRFFVSRTQRGVPGPAFHDSVSLASPAVWEQS